MDILKSKQRERKGRKPVASMCSCGLNGKEVATRRKGSCDEEERKLRRGGKKGKERTPNFKVPSRRKLGPQKMKSELYHMKAL
jgi:hypothetical protein